MTTTLSRPRSQAAAPIRHTRAEILGASANERVAAMCVQPGHGHRRSAARPVRSLWRRRLRPAGYSMCSSSAAGRSSSARASFVMVRSRGSRPARSSSDTSVRCRLQASPSASWERPAASRAARRFVANCATGSTLLMLDACGQNLYRQHVAPGRSRELLSALSEGPTPTARSHDDRPPRPAGGCPAAGHSRRPDHCR